MIDEGLHDPEDSQTDARELHKDEGEEALRCDHDMISLVNQGLVKSRYGSFGSFCHIYILVSIST